MSSGRDVEDLNGLLTRVCFPTARFFSGDKCDHGLTFAGLDQQGRAGMTGSGYRHDVAVRARASPPRAAPPITMTSTSSSYSGTSVLVAKALAWQWLRNGSPWSLSAKCVRAEAKSGSNRSPIGATLPKYEPSRYMLHDVTFSRSAGRRVRLVRGSCNITPRALGTSLAGGEPRSSGGYYDANRTCKQIAELIDKPQSAD